MSGKGGEAHHARGTHIAAISYPDRWRPLGNRFESRRGIA
jgi:hypothetical protein